MQPGNAGRESAGMTAQPWLMYALLSALCASLVAIFGKMGVKGIDSTLATTVRTVVMTAFFLAVCAARGLFGGLSSLRPFPVVMLVLSGLAGAGSWLFYYRALQIGEVAQVAPIDKLSMPIAVVLAVIIFGDRPGPVNWLGIVMMVAGGYLAAMPAKPG